jgi:hypothetical protein
VNENGHRVILASLESQTDDTEDTTIADDSMAVVDTLRKAMSEGDVDVLRERIRQQPRWSPARWAKQGAGRFRSAVT